MSANALKTNVLKTVRETLIKNTFLSVVIWDINYALYTFRVHMKDYVNSSQCL